VVLNTCVLLPNVGLYSPAYSAICVQRCTVSSASPAQATSESNSDISAERRRLVDEARQVWIRKLIDLSRRNNLLYFRPLKTGTIDLTDSPHAKLAALFVGESVSVRGLVDEHGIEDSGMQRAREIARRAQANAEERGLQTMFVAFGVATWTADDGGRPSEAPVLLLPIAVEPGGRGTQNLNLVRAGTPQANLVLLHVLESQFGVRLSGDELLQLVLGDEEGEKFDLDPLYEHIRRVCQPAVPGFGIRRAAVLGNFSFQKMALVKDILECGQEMAANDLIAAIAGDSAARARACSAGKDVNPRDLDTVPPDNEFLILDADSSQQSAIAGVLQGRNTVVHGPPGTGKSQTIANLIASLAAEGKRILFVAEKRAALEVVLRRLTDAGLGHLAIDLHGADVSTKRVAEQINAALQRVRQAAPVDCEKVHQRLEKHRAKLNAHVQRLHTPREPLGMSVYEMQGSLVRLTGVQSKTRWKANDLAHFSRSKADEIVDLLEEASGLADLITRKHQSPWTCALLHTGKEVAEARSLVEETCSEIWPRFVGSVNTLEQSSGLRPASSVAAAREQLNLMSGVNQTLCKYKQSVFQEQLAVLVDQLTPAEWSWAPRAWAWVTNSAFRNARSAALSHRRERKASPRELRQEMMSAANQLARWHDASHDKTTPHEVPGVEKVRAAFDAAHRAVSDLQRILGRSDLLDLETAVVRDLLTGLHSDSVVPDQLPKVHALERRLQELGTRAFLKELRQTECDPERWSNLFHHALWMSCLDMACEQDPELKGFVGRTHTRIVEEFTDLDEERIALAAARVSRAHGERAVEAMNRNPNQEFLVRAEAEKVRRHKPLRRLFAEASDVLTALCPCWMASPLSVSQLLDARKKYFDVVIFDEASQVLPEDAVCAVLRGTSLVVAGDRHQLPPTTFFAAAEEDEIAAAESSATDGFESLLDMLNAFLPGAHLEWHYRSRDEALISFSNNYIYKNRLVTFPGAGTERAVAHVLVQQEHGVDGQEESSAPEVRTVVDLVLQHARGRPMETLGVIAMGIRHADRIQRVLDQALEQCPELDEFFDQGRSERFFVKNLERVQGDERDAIVLSVGYGKDRAGNLPFRFGPLLSEGGRRRLNVAVTRARRRMTVVSSFSHLDMDLTRVRPGTGVELLRQYLQYAASGGDRLGDVQLTTTPMNGFEADVYDALVQRDIRVVSQVGASRFRIDLVAEHPHKPGRCVLAIECDGASYHSSYTARDRDRLRQQQLENLGWRFHRVWSTDWFLRKEEEIERLLRAYESAVQHADQVDNGEFASTGASSVHGISTGPRGTQREPRPRIPARSSIVEYTRGELTKYVDWINSDGQLRTDEEIITEMVSLLGFSRRGSRIQSAIRYAIAEWKRRD